MSEERERLRAEPSAPSDNGPWIVPPWPIGPQYTGPVEWFDTREDAERAGRRSEG